MHWVAAIQQLHHNSPGPSSDSLLQNPAAEKEPQWLFCLLGRQHTATLRELPTPFNFRLNFVLLLSVFSRWKERFQLLHLKFRYVQVASGQRLQRICKVVSGRWNLW